jgi:hypothetical protein
MKPQIQDKTMIKEYKKGDVMHTRRCGVCSRLNSICCYYHSESALCPECYENFEEIDRITVLNREMQKDALIDTALETIRLLELGQKQ